MKLLAKMIHYYKVHSQWGDRAHKGVKIGSWRTKTSLLLQWVLALQTSILPNKILFFSICFFSIGKHYIELKLIQLTN